MRLPLTIVLLSILALPAVAQVVDIRGVVSDSATGERIPFANVILKETGKGAATNNAGFYIITSVAPGVYEIVVSSVGYQRQSREIRVGGTAPIIANFRLTSEAVEIEEIVVSGRAKAEQLELQTSIHTMDKAELKKIPVAAQGDILRSIQILPGIVSTSDVNAQFYVRGGSSDQNLVLVDGMRLYNPFHAFGLFSTVNPDLIRTAEVYTGAFPAEFGGRLSSVINLTTRDGNAAHFNGRSNINFLSSSLNLEGPISNSVQTLFSGRKSLFSGTFKNFLKEKIPLSFYDAFLKFTVKDPESQDNVSVQALMSYDDLLAINPGDPTYSWT
ncbi:MAG TPA: TonB-dependent receptor, partial [Bacteroidota bacterium]